MIVIIQGESYPIPVLIQYKAEDLTMQPVAPEHVNKVEMTFGTIKKYYPGDITYDEDTKMFNFPLTQNETLSLSGAILMQVRCLFKNGNVKAYILDPIKIRKGFSSVILEV